MKNAITKIMYSHNPKTFDSLLSFVLWIIAILYRMIINARNWMYDHGMCKVRRVNRPVICVGNVAVGGTGKTPMVEYLLRLLNAREKSVAVLTRGYMPQSKVHVMSDEVRMLKHKFPDIPLLVGVNRYQSAKQYLERLSCDAFIMDDGFQHRQFYRDLNIVLIDATHPLDNEFLIPRGILREPLTSLKRADCIVLTKVDQAKNVDDLVNKLLTVQKNIPIIQTRHVPVSLYDPISTQCRGLSFLENKKVYAFCGIGNPDGFTKTLEALSAHVVGVYSFNDHAVYADQDIKNIISEASTAKADVIITTEKDLVKLEPDFGLFAKSIDLLVLGVEIKVVKGEELLHERIADLL